MDPSVSVVIALHDDMPSENVDALAAQSVPLGPMEVVVVDGWHAPGASDAVERAMRSVGHPAMRCVRIPRAGRAACWNAGIAATTAPVVLLLADDCRPVPDLVARHLDLHLRRTEAHVAGIGPSVFPSHLRGSRFRRWLDDSGRLFGVSFAREEPPEIAGFFYGANASLKREFLERAGRFDESYPHHGWDDYEMGRRLFDRGMEIVYLDRALAFHEHALTLRERRAVMREAGESAAIFQDGRDLPEAWDELVKMTAWATWWRAAGAALRSTTGRGAGRFGEYFAATLDRQFVRGYRRARRERAPVALPEATSLR